MKKHLLYFLFILFSYGISARVEVDISGMIFNTKAGEIYLVKQDQGKVTTFLKGKLDKEGNFKLKGEVPVEDYYILLVGNHPIELVIRKNIPIKVYGDGSNLSEFTNIVGSLESSRLNEFLKIRKEWADKIRKSNEVLKKDPSKRDSVNRAMEREFNLFKSRRKTFLFRNRNSPALIALVPTYDKDKEFAEYESIVQQLERSFATSTEVQKVVKEYQTILKKREATNQFAPGKIAPDFEGTKPDGSKMKLSDLRGKYVLIDFWASWCGPCRRENPSVVNLYNQYKSKGFTIMSVSLDRDKNKWVEAIKKDKLSWPNHVSDLKGWQSDIGRLYNVSSIPYTVLIDKEGKIIRTKLRAHDLEITLRELFGE